MLNSYAMGLFYNVLEKVTILDPFSSSFMFYFIWI